MSEAITRLERFAVVETVFDEVNAVTWEVAALIYDRQGNRLHAWETLVRPYVYLGMSRSREVVGVTYEEMMSAPFPYDAGPAFRCLLEEWQVQMATAWNVRATFGIQQLGASEWCHHPTYINNGIAGYLNSFWLHTDITERVSATASAMERATYSADALMAGNKFSPFKQFLKHADEYLQHRTEKTYTPVFTRQDLAALRAGGAR